MKAVVRTDCGNVMPVNQDAALVLDGTFPVYAVADGMGGHKGGNVASSMAIEAVRQTLEDQTPNEDTLRKCFITANREIFLKQGQDENLSGMGTTLTVLWDAGETFYLGHVGDSRCYLLREGTLYQMSSDHSLVAELVRDGVLQLEEADTYPYRNVITRAVGTGKCLTPDITMPEKMRGDRWLICSDGLTEYIKPGALLAFMQQNNMDEAADRMMAKALGLGGRDNITLILLEVDA